jgi:hypothetical protein
MPKTPNTPQITTPAPRRLKAAWDKECNRLKWEVDGVAYPGTLQKGLIALFLAEPDPSRREDIAEKAIAEYDKTWREPDESVPGSLETGIGTASRTGSKVDRKRKRKPVTKARAPDRVD